MKLSVSYCIFNVCSGNRYVVFQLSAKSHIMKHIKFFLCCFLPALMVLFLFTACASANMEQEQGISQTEYSPVITMENDKPREMFEPWTSSRLESELAGNDPLEGFNRCMFAFNDFCMIYLARPLGWVYCSVLPRPVINCIDNASSNLEFPGHLITCLGRGEWNGSLDELCRFLLNTTVGIGGLFDPAKHWFHFYPTGSNFGQMFAHWGIGPGCTLILPFSSNINVRDSIGSIFDSLFDIKLIIPFSSLTNINTVMVYHPVYESLLSGSRDRYKMYRSAMLLNRELQQELWFYHYANNMVHYHKHPEDAPPPQTAKRPPILKKNQLKGNVIEIPQEDYLPQDPYSDTTRMTLFVPQKSDHYWYLPLSCFNRDFEELGDLRSIRITQDAPKVRYMYWQAKEKNSDDSAGTSGKPAAETQEKLAFILPGIGSSYHGDTALAMAELMNNNGYHVVTVDSAFTWRFMAGAGQNELPGYALKDAANMRILLSRILESLKREKKIQDPRITMIGWSFGGVHTLNIAAMEEKEEILHVDRFIALNPPADLDYALKTIDHITSESKNWDLHTMREYLVDAAGKQLLYAAEALPPYQTGNEDKSSVQRYVPDLNPEQSRYLVALTMKMTIRELLLQERLKNPLPGINTDFSTFNRNDFYLEADKIGFYQYATEILQPQLAEQCRSNAGTAEKLGFKPGEIPDYKALIQKSDLRNLTDTLKNNKKVRMIHTLDDFLINEKDIAFCDQVLQDRVTWFNVGGHCGHFYLTDFQKCLLEAADGIW